MADNTTLSAGAGGDTLATDDIGGIKFPRSKIVIGADGTNDGDVSGTNPLPVKGTGTAGTANAGVVTVQGIASMTPVQVADNGSSITVDWNGTAPPIGAGLEATALRVTIATDSTGVISVDDNGSTISIDDGAGSITVDGTVAISGTVTTSVSGTVAVTDNSGSLTVDNAGTFAVQATVAAGATNIAKAEDVASADADVGVPSMAVRKATPANTSGTDGDYEFLQMSAGRLWTSTVIDTALPAGTNAIGKLASNTGVTIGAVEIAAAQTLATVTTVTTVATVTNLSQLGGSAIAMNTGTRSAGTQRVTIATDDVVPASQSGTWTVQPGNTANTTAWLTTDTPATSGGLSMSSFLSTAAVQSTQIKGSAGQVYALEFFNIGATPMYVRLYNQTGAPAGGDNANIVWRGVIPGNTAGAGFVQKWNKGLAFSTGIGMRCTGAIADTDTTALSANVVIGNVEYK